MAIGVTIVVAEEPSAGSLGITGATSTITIEIAITPTGVLSIEPQIQEAQLTVALGHGEGAISVAGVTQSIAADVPATDLNALTGEHRISGLVQNAGVEIATGLSSGALTLEARTQTVALDVGLATISGAENINGGLLSPAFDVAVVLPASELISVLTITGNSLTITLATSAAEADVLVGESRINGVTQNVESTLAATPTAGTLRIEGNALDAVGQGVPAIPGAIVVTIVVAEEPSAGSLRIIGGAQTSSQEDEIVLSPQSGSIVVSAGLPASGITFGPAPSVSSLTINGQDIDVLLGTAIPTNVFPANGTWDFDMDFPEIEGKSSQADVADGQISFSGNVVSLVAFRRWQKVPPQTDGWQKIASF